MKLAKYGGIKLRNKPFLDYNSIGQEELEAVKKVINSGCLSAFYGSNSKEFYGGPNVKKLEEMWKDYYNVHGAVSANSATSALIMAIGALGIGPGDEVIVTPLTMSATATAIIVFNGIPIFSDIEDEFYGLDPNKIENKINSNTKAIIVTNLFGHGAKMELIMNIAKKYNLKVIEDCAQAPGVKYRGELLGKYGDIGVFSYNCHKTIQSGEGGVAITDDEELALRMMLIRNHAEAVIGTKPFNNISVNMIGFNFRMTEMEAAVAIEQFKKLDRLNEEREILCNYLNSELSSIDGLIVPKVDKDSSHAYYVYPIRIDKNIIEIGIDDFIDALKEEGIPFFKYGKPLYMLQIYKNLQGYGEIGCPWNCPYYDGKVRYYDGLCEVAEKISIHELMVSEICRQPNTIEDMGDIVKGFKKIIENQEEIINNA